MLHLDSLRLMMSISEEGARESWWIEKAADGERNGRPKISTSVAGQRTHTSALRAK